MMYAVIDGGTCYYSKLCHVGVVKVLFHITVRPQGRVKQKFELNTNWYICFIMMNYGMVYQKDPNLNAIKKI